MAPDDDTNGHHLDGPHKQSTNLNSMADEGVQKQNGLEIGQQPEIPRSNSGGLLFNDAWNFYNLDGDKQTACDSMAEQTISSTIALATGISPANITSAPDIEVHSPSIFRLPIETLTHIFTYVRGLVRRDADYMLYRQSNQIKNVRLACKKFCDASSHLLVYDLSLKVDNHSLSVLEAASLHPRISKGIKRIQLRLLFYSVELVEDIQKFKMSHREGLENAIRYAYKRLSRADGPEEMGKALYVLSELEDIADSWQIPLRKIPHRPVVPWEYSDGRWRRLAVAAGEILNYSLLLLEAHEYYKLCYIKQQELLENGFVEAVAAAISRMPNARALSLHDDDDDDESKPYNEKLAAHMWYKGATNHAKLLRDMVAPSSLETLRLLMDDNDYETATLSAPKGINRMPITLPIAVHKAGTWLTSFSVGVKTPIDLSCLAMSKKETNQLKGAMQRLADFTFVPKPHEIESEGNEWSQDELGCLTDYLGAVMNTDSLEKITLEFEPYDSQPQPIPGFGALLAARPWPKLRVCELHCLCFRLEDMKGFTKQMEHKTGSEFSFWDCILEDGSWAEVLDTLRTKASRLWRLEHPEGAGCDDLSSDEKKWIFRTASRTDGMSTSPAEQYIRGEIDQNPLRGLFDDSNSDSDHD